MSEQLILVDHNDKEIGSLEKLKVHQTGVLHRAFSVFIFNSKGELLIQQRAEEKYHSPGVWSNTCCGHPNVNEQTADAALRRLNEEMGMQCRLTFQFKFTYCAAFDNGLTEHEIDHVYYGISNHEPVRNPREVKAWKYISLADLQADMLKNPEKFSAWLNICLPQIVNSLN